MRGLIRFHSLPDGCRVQLDFVPNYYRLLAPLGTVLAVMGILVYAGGTEGLKTMMMVLARSFRNLHALDGRLYTFSL